MVKRENHRGKYDTHDEVIQFVTFLSPIVGGQQRPLSLGHLRIPKRSPADLPGCFYG